MHAEYIFVYGTLRKDTTTEMHGVLARHSEYFSAGYMQGRLYDAGGYPGAVESNDTGECVYGELRKLISSDLVLPLLDDYEECSNKFAKPHEYVRKKLPIKLTNGDQITAWIYLYNREVSGLLRIESGDYTIYIKKIRHK